MGTVAHLACVLVGQCVLRASLEPPCEALYQGLACALAMQIVRRLHSGEIALGMLPLELAQRSTSKETMVSDGQSVRTTEPAPQQKQPRGEAHVRRSMAGQGQGGTHIEGVHFAIPGLGPA